MKPTNLEWTDELWNNPPSIYRSAPFWSWNRKLQPDRLVRQIEQMHEAGMGGFFMHSRYGLQTPYLSDEWFDAIRASVEKARQLNMKAYLYDEDRWPSGSAGGAVTRDRPEYAVHRLVAVRTAQLPAQPPMDYVATFAVRFDAAGAVSSYRRLALHQEAQGSEQVLTIAVASCKPWPWYNDAPYIDVLNRQAVGEFIRITHEAYADHCGQDFGGAIPAIFTDEPNYWQIKLNVPEDITLPQHVAWTAALPEEFRLRRGYDLLDHMPELFFALTGQIFSKVRHDYYRTLTEVFAANWSGQISQWCAQHNIIYTGHYSGEYLFAEQIPCMGAAMPQYEHEPWPGIDILTDQRDEISTCKQASSVASQMGHERVLSELYGVTGWDWPLEGHKFNAGWQYALGVNFRCQHLSLYSLAGGAKRDFPASIFPHSPWWKFYRTVEDYFARLSLMLTQGQAVRDVLLVSPIESAWGCFLPFGHMSGELPLPGWADYRSIVQTLCDQHYDYDLGDESLLAKYAKVGPGQLRVGKMKYSLVLVPSSLTLRKSTVALLRKLMEAGVAVVFAGTLPDRTDGEPSGEMKTLTETAACCDIESGAVTTTLERLLPRRVSITEGGCECTDMWYMLRQVKGGQLLFVQSCDRQHGRKVRVSVQGRRPVVLWDLATGTRQRVEAQSSGNRVQFELDLPSTGSALVSLGLPARDARPPAKPEVVTSRDSLAGPWEIELAEPNVLPLDCARLKIEDGPESDYLPVLLADENIRKHFGLPARGNEMCQPWYLAQTGRWDSAPRGRCTLSFGFAIQDVPSTLRLAIERPEDYEILLNGQAVASQSIGSWVDEDIQVVDLRSAARTGQNELVLKFNYHSDMEIEDLHLLGDFGIRQLDGRRRRDSFTLVAAPRQLGAGSWVGQGLDFYGSSVKYRIALDGSIGQAAAAGKKVRLSLPNVQCTCAAIHVGGQSFVLPWAPMSADITSALLAQAAGGCEHVIVEVIGGRHNSFGPLHVPWGLWTGPAEFDPHNKDWTDEYLLNDHGLMSEPVIELME